MEVKDFNKRADLDAFLVTLGSGSFTRQAEYVGEHKVSENYFHNGEHVATLFLEKPLAELAEEMFGVKQCP